MLLKKLNLRNNFLIAACGVSGALYMLILCVTGCSCMYSCFYRSKLRGQYFLEESPCTDCCIHCCCEECALCQEYRELKNLGFDMSIGIFLNLFLLTIVFSYYQLSNLIDEHMLDFEFVFNSKGIQQKFVLYVVYLAEFTLTSRIWSLNQAELDECAFKTGWLLRINCVFLISYNLLEEMVVSSYITIVDMYIC